MNVILLEKMSNLGEIGDTAKVKSGYARNFLFPQGKAIQATKQNMAEFEVRKSELLARHNSKVAAAQIRAAKVNGVTLMLRENAGDEGKLFGSVGTKDSVEALNAQTGSDILKSEVMMPHGVIRTIGQYEIELNLGYDIGAKVSLSVQRTDSVGVSDDGRVEEDDPAETEADSE